MKKNEFEVKGFEVKGFIWYRPGSEYAVAWINGNEIKFHHADVRWLNVMGRLIGDVELNRLGKIIGDE